MRRTLLPTVISTVLVVGLVAGHPGAVLGQRVVIDEGSFTLLRDGREVGTERFVIRRAGAGDDALIYASSVLEYDDGSTVLEMSPKLETDANRLPQLYQNEIGGADVSSVRISPGNRRYEALIESEVGERERQLRAEPGMVFLEGYAVHQYYFVPTTEGATFPVIVPHLGEQVPGRVTRVEEESVRIGGTSVEARRVTLDIGGEERQLWLDPQDRVLRLVIEARAFRAERESL